MPHIIFIYHYICSFLSFCLSSASRGRFKPLISGLSVKCSTTKAQQLNIFINYYISSFSLNTAGRLIRTLDLRVMCRAIYHLAAGEQ